MEAGQKTADGDAEHRTAGVEGGVGTIIKLRKNKR